LRVGNSERALSVGYTAADVAVRGEHFASIGAESVEEGFCLLFAEHRKERGRVHGGRAKERIGNARFDLKPRREEIQDGVRLLTFGNEVRIVDDHTRAGGKADPVSIRVGEL